MLTKSTSTVFCIISLLLQLANAGPLSGTVVTDTCALISGAGAIANGEWNTCGTINGHWRFCQDGNSFQVLQQQFHLLEDESVNSILGYCSVTDPDHIFDCSAQYFNGNKPKPDSNFEPCFKPPSRRRARRLSTLGGCWPTNDPRIVSFVDTYNMILLWRINIDFLELQADPLAGCSGGHPIYKSAPALLPNQFVLKYANNRWELTYGTSSTVSYCTEANLNDCQATNWQSTGPWATTLTGAIVFDEYLACQYMEEARDIRLRGTSIIRGMSGCTGRFCQSSVSMSIDYDERCFDSRPARKGFLHGYAVYISFYWVGSTERWILNRDYISYVAADIVDYCDFLQPISDCDTTADWNSGISYIQVTSTGLSLYGQSTRGIMYHDLPSSKITTLAACAALNIAIMVAQCIYKKRNTAKIIAE